MNEENVRLAALRHAEEQAQQLFDAIEAKGLIAPGRTEREVEKDIYALAARDFNVEKHWHKRIVRAGINTLTIAADNPPVIDILADDMVFVDLGPVFEEWEADVGRTYVLGDDPVKHRLKADLPRHFEKLRAHFDAHQDITGAELFAAAEKFAAEDGWLWGGQIAGHLVGEFPHARIPGDKDLYRISPDNPSRMRDPDASGQTKYWILEVHLVNQDRSWGGFYERLLLPDPV
ncbi:M24 family metallopeptidase [Roseococcus pinisoli]|uniref:Aminopeptidase P family protein n=1 Tax=Roseococcus pinisoli TaxID=2835040 RepID=A0ABS5QDM1_9PROT|nr:M24 family metallopeptidase [Roseococcus pinisoli]MBS7811801.1 aminopeptidase P family protein [Roseococcus pinisoli]